MPPEFQASKRINNARCIPHRAFFIAASLHMLAKLADHEDDVLLADKARAAGLAMHPLSRWYINAKPQQGLLLGFANVIDERDAKNIVMKFKQAID